MLDLVITLSRAMPGLAEKQALTTPDLVAIRSSFSLVLVLMLQAALGHVVRQAQASPGLAAMASPGLAAIQVQL